MPDLASIVKAYDIRGVVPDQLDESVARDIGAAFVRFLGASAVVTAHDMRESSPGLASAFAEGAMSQGADVIEAGLGSTDLLYYASGRSARWSSRASRPTTAARGRDPVETCLPTTLRT